MASHICYPVIPSTKSCTTTHLLAQQPLLGLSGSFRMHQGLHGAIHLQRLIFLATEHLVGRDFLLEKLCDLCVLCGRSRILPDCAVNTSSAAQGGGGSFKNRKPIGEVGCCESRMAERIHCWTERWLELCFLEWLQWLQWSPYWM